MSFEPNASIPGCIDKVLEIECAKNVAIAFSSDTNFVPEVVEWEKIWE